MPLPAPPPAWDIMFSTILDANSRIRAITSGTDQELRFERDPRGLEVRRHLPGGMRLEQRFDSMGRIVEQQLGRTATTALPHHSSQALGERDVIKRDYRYDPSGLLVSIVDGRWGWTEYSHDPADRLFAVLRERGGDERFEYDSTDNLTSAVNGNGAGPARAHTVSTTAYLRETTRLTNTTLRGDWCVRRRRRRAFNR